MNRFIQIGSYRMMGTNSSEIVEMLDTKTGIVYMRTSAYEGPDNIVPMLFDNGKPQHMNKEEITRIQQMIATIGEKLYEDICCTNHSNYWESTYENEYATIRYFADRDWTIEDVYTKVCYLQKCA